MYASAVRQQKQGSAHNMEHANTGTTMQTTVLKAPPERTKAVCESAAE